MDRRDLLTCVRQYLFGTFRQAGDGDKDSPSSYTTETSPLLAAAACSTDGRTISRASTLRQEQQDVVVRPCNADVGWQFEAKIVISWSTPLVITFLLQYSIDALSLIAAGRIGKLELGAVSLANMSAAITCFAPVQGIATSLDTLCAQAYGSGRKHLIGLYCQRVTLFLLLVTAPVSILWLYSRAILVHLVEDAETALLASSYLKVLIPSIPGYILFETGKRFLQAQGLFRATTYILLVAAPCHAAILRVLVREYGFIGAPIAVGITRTLIPVLLLLYVKFIKGSACWGGLGGRVFSGWRTMIGLAIPGMVMVEAEYLAFEVMIIASSRFGADYLAAQSILAALATISFQIPFSMSIAASTRVATLIGAGSIDHGKVAAKTAVIATCITGCINFFIYVFFRNLLPFIFTEDPTVAALATQVLPLLGVTTFLEGLAIAAHGLLRGIGRQSIGGPTTISAYYLVALPTSLALGFGLGWRLHGLLLGLTIGLSVVSLFEYGYLYLTDWQRTAADAAARNAAG